MVVFRVHLVIIRVAAVVPTQQNMTTPHLVVVYPPLLPMTMPRIICSHHGFSANTGATSNIVPVAVNAIHLDADWDESLDAILDAAALRVDQDGILSNHETVRISTTKVDKVCTFFNLRVFIKE